MVRGKNLLEIVQGLAVGLRARLKGRADSEHEQAILRIVLVGLITVYMWGRISAVPTAVADHDHILLVGLAGFFVMAISIFVAICVWPASNVPRRVVGMVADAGGTTFALFLAGDSGVGLVGVYLFITFGNGFRYGRNYLFLCQALCLSGFIPVVILARWWNEEPYIGWGLMVSMIVLPLYVSTLLKRIHEARTKAEEANRAKSSFLANMSHEMRTPLNGIVGVAELLQTTSLNKEQRELVQLLRNSVVLLRSLVDDVLDISKIEAGRLTIETTDFDLYATLNSIIRMMRPHAAAKGLAVRAMVDPAIEYHVKGDPHHFRQVLVNLLSNAVKFTERGHIEVSAVLIEEIDDEMRVRFSVSDTGIGISPEAQQKIFQQFVQADDSTTRRYGGTGLGTSIAKQLVGLMGGIIGVDSALGFGSTFWFELPFARFVNEVAPSEVEALASGSSTTLLLADASALPHVAPLVAAACGKFELIKAARLVVTELRRLREQAVIVPAVVVAGDANVACDIFEQIAAESSDLPTALIYLASVEPADVQRQRLRSIEGASYLGLDVSARLLRNAIHAATSSVARESAEIIDLGLVLKQQRQTLRILVAEDNATNQTILRQLLESAGHTVILANDGEEALDCFEVQRPDIAILDFNMPERSGIEVTSAIRLMEPAGVRLPILVLSASVTPETRERVKNAGADDFVGKPFDAAKLLQVVDRLARNARRDDSSRAKATATVSHAAIQLVDRARLYEIQQISSDRAFLRRLADGFFSDVEGNLHRLEAAISSDCATPITDITHAIVGASVGIGAAQLAARCSEIDRASQSGEKVRLPTLVAELRKCFEMTAAQLSTLVLEDYRATR
jgi:two-component system sensor histidine kinase RpfC